VRLGANRMDPCTTQRLSKLLGRPRKHAARRSRAGSRCWDGPAYPLVQRVKRFIGVLLSLTLGAKPRSACTCGPQCWLLKQSTSAA
jgi:hypothetical protein